MAWKRDRNLSVAARSACSGSMSRWRATLTTANNRSPSSSTDGLGAQFLELLGDLGHRAVDVGRVPVEPDRGRLAPDLGRVEQRGQRRRDALHHAVAALLRLLDLLPVGDDLAGRVGRRPSRTRAGGRDELVVDAARDIGQRELARFGSRASCGTRSGTAGRRAPPRGAGNCRAGRRWRRGSRRSPPRDDG